VNVESALNLILLSFFCNFIFFDNLVTFALSNNINKIHYKTEQNISNKTIHLFPSLKRSLISSSNFSLCVRSYCKLYYQVSISSTLYVQIFRTNDVFSTYMYLTRENNIRTKNSYVKCRWNWAQIRLNGNEFDLSMYVRSVIRNLDNPDLSND